MSDLAPILARVEDLAREVSSALRGRRVKGQREARRTGRRLLTQSFRVIEDARLALSEGLGPQQGGAISDIETLCGELEGLAEGFEGVLAVMRGEVAPDATSLASPPAPPAAPAPDQASSPAPPGPSVALEPPPAPPVEVSDAAPPTPEAQASGATDLASPRHGGARRDGGPSPRGRRDP